MAKALLVYSNRGDGVSSGDMIPLSGGPDTVATEANVQWAITTAGTLSNLSLYNTAGSGTNTVQLRKNGANGNLVSSTTGTGFQEDNVNTDGVTSGDLFNWAATDTGTNPSYGHIRVLYAATSGQVTQCFANGNSICDATNNRFARMSGALIADWTADETAYRQKSGVTGTLKNFQVVVSVNAGTSTRTFRTRINGANGNGIVTFLAGTTGRAVDTTNTDALTANTTDFGMLIEPLTSIDDITPSMAGAEIVTTSGTASDLLKDSSVTGAILSRAASATAHYTTIGGCAENLTLTADTDVRVRPGFAGTASNLRIHLTANTYAASSGTFKIKNLTDATEMSITLGGGGTGTLSNTADTLAFDANDELVYEFDEGTSGSITYAWAGVTLAETVAAAGLGPLISGRRNALIGGGLMLQ